MAIRVASSLFDINFPQVWLTLRTGQLLGQVISEGRKVVGVVVRAR